MGELGEDEYLFALNLALLQQLPDQDHLPTRIHHFLHLLLNRLTVLQQIELQFLDQEGVVAALPQLDLQIVQVCVVGVV